MCLRVGEGELRCSDIFAWGCVVCLLSVHPRKGSTRTILTHAASGGRRCCHGFVLHSAFVHKPNQRR